MLSTPITLTFDRKQYHPLGFNSSRLVPPMTLTAGFTRTRDGESVRMVSAGRCPMPKTLTDVAGVVYLGLLPKGCLPQALRQVAMDGSTSSASDGVFVLGCVGDSAAGGGEALWICLSGGVSPPGRW